jgi:hypothetical protein
MGQKSGNGWMRIAKWVYIKRKERFEQGKMSYALLAFFFPVSHSLPLAFSGPYE